MEKLYCCEKFKNSSYLGYHALSDDYALTDPNNGIAIDEKISFCPFCGAKLKGLKEQIENLIEAQ